MLLKRLYKTPEGWERKVNTRKESGELVDPAQPEGVCLNPPPLDGVAIAHTGVDARQLFSTRLVEGAIGEGWMSLSKGKLTLHATSDDLVYAVKRVPGHYCSHCVAKLEGEQAAKEHVAAAHAGVPSPDKNNPAGYEKLNGYDCELDSAQHVKYRSLGKPVYKFHRAKKGS